LDDQARPLCAGEWKTWLKGRTHGHTSTADPRILGVNAFMGWIGTVLGAIGILFAASTASTTWTAHHHAMYLALWVLAVACLAIVVVLPLRHGPGWLRFRLMV
jgi:hypothetical protein